MFDPELIHDHMTKAGVFLGKHKITIFIINMLYGYQNQALEQKIKGINFPNPIGLAAGFDKNAELTAILPSIGFGYEEVGSITGNKCNGNKGQKLWRLPKSKSLVVYYGLKNKGAKAISKKLRNKKFKFPIGISIAKTNDKTTIKTEDGIKDYIKAYKAFSNIGDYYTINISCPNAFGGQPFTDYEKLNSLLHAISKLPKTKPIFLKISPDLKHSQINQIIKLSQKHKIDGFICTNLTKNKQNKTIKEKTPDVGGLSGKVVEKLSNDLIKYIYKKTKGKFIIIGCGGVFTAQDAYEKIKLGANLIQLITGMIYLGPQTISNINIGLVDLLKKDGYTNISEAIGKK